MSKGLLHQLQKNISWFQFINTPSLNTNKFTASFIRFNNPRKPLFDDEKISLLIVLLWNTLYLCLQSVPKRIWIVCLKVFGSNAKNVFFYCLFNESNYFGLFFWQFIAVFVNFFLWTSISHVLTCHMATNITDLVDLDFVVGRFSIVRYVGK